MRMNANIQKPNKPDAAAGRAVRMHITMHSNLKKAVGVIADRRGFLGASDYFQDYVRREITALGLEEQFLVEHR